jgi:hypothetical protein
MDEYDGITVQFNKKYKFKCNRCGGKHDFDLTRGTVLRCPKCDASMSIFQTEIVDYLKQLLPNEPIVTNNRAILSPLELDIYVPSKNLAIEADGIYYHSEVSGGKNQNYHLNKTKACAIKGIQLIHVLESDWTHKNKVVKSILKNLLLASEHIIDAKDCVVKELTPKIKSDFLDESDLRGNVNSMVRLGLFFNNGLVAVMTFSTAKFSKTGSWEVDRCCFKTNTVVVGGFEKLFNHFIEIHKPPRVFAYCDRMYFSGEAFLKLGFNFVENLPPRYHYIIDTYDTLENPINWQKSKLAKKLVAFDPALSEWENMKVNGFDRIWDCGHSKWIFIAPKLLG